MTALSRSAVRGPLLVLLWGLVAAVVWIMSVQLFLLLLNPFCHAQRPEAFEALVHSVDHDPNSQITDFVTVKRGEAERVLRVSKSEAASLQPDEEVWLLGAWYEDNLRPTHFRLTPLRILLEYPFLLLLPAAWGLWGIRRARQQAEAAPLPPVRRTFTDDFHLRAQRFAQPGSPEGPEGGASAPPPASPPPSPPPDGPA